MFIRNDLPQRRRYDINDLPQRRRYDINDLPQRRRYDINDLPQRRRYDINDLPQRRRYDINDLPQRRRYDINDLPQRRRYDINDLPQRRRYGINDLPQRRRYDINDLPQRRRYDINDLPQRRRYDINDLPQRRRYDINDLPQRRRYDINAEIFDDIDDSYWFWNTMMRDITKKHDPAKTRTLKGNRLPYMNGELRRDINVKHMLKRKFSRCNSGVNWENYRKQRKIVTQLRRKSMQMCMRNKYRNAKNNGEFWKAVEPLISNKVINKDDNMFINIDGNVVNDPSDLCRVFKTYFTNIAYSIGPNDTIYGSCHEVSYLRITLAIDILDSVLFIEWRLLTTSFVVV